MHNIIVYYLESDESIHRRLRPTSEVIASDTAEHDTFEVTEGSIIFY
jgi:hypothetical protein